MPVLKNKLGLNPNIEQIYGEIQDGQEICFIENGVKRFSEIQKNDRYDGGLKVGSKSLCKLLEESSWALVHLPSNR